MSDDWCRQVEKRLDNLDQNVANLMKIMVIGILALAGVEIAI